MTTWSELDDLGLGGEPTDEFDPLAPMVDSPQAADEWDDAQDDDKLPRSVRGFADGLGVLRVWIDEERHIVKVRISPSWRDRLKKAGGDESLSTRFVPVFQQINNYFERGDVPEAPHEVTRVAKHPLSWDTLRETAEKARSINDRLMKLAPDEGYGRWVGTDAVGTSADGQVRLTISCENRLKGITFNEKWLEEARVRQVTDNVVQAYNDARSKFVPGTYEEGERDQISREAQDNNQELLAMMRRGFA